MFPSIEFENLDRKGNNVIHIYAKKNFVRCLKRVLKLVPDEHTAKSLMSHQNDNGNNPFMSCVFKNSNDALNFLLCTIEFLIEYLHFLNQS